VWMLELVQRLVRADRRRGSFKLMLCSSSGVVMTKMMSSTNARSSSGVMLDFTQCHEELFASWGKPAHWCKIIRRQIPFSILERVPARNYPGRPVNYARIMHQANCKSEHRGIATSSPGDRRDERRRDAGPPSPPFVAAPCCAMPQRVSSRPKPCRANRMNGAPLTRNREPGSNRIP